MPPVSASVWTPTQYTARVSSSTLVLHVSAPDGIKASLPALELAVFGSVTPPDVSSAYSSFSDPQGNLFFGTTASENVRFWAINAVQQEVVWAELATSAEVVRDGSFSDSGFNAVWNPAFEFFHTVNDQNVSVNNITAAFQTEGKFAP